MAAASKKDVGIQLKIIASAANSAPIAGTAILMAELMNGVKKLARVAMTKAAILIELLLTPDFPFSMNFSPSDLFQ